MDFTVCQLWKGAFWYLYHKSWYWQNCSVGTGSCASSDWLRRDCFWWWNMEGRRLLLYWQLPFMGKGCRTECHSGYSQNKGIYVWYKRSCWRRSVFPGKRTAGFLCGTLGWDGKKIWSVQRFCGIWIVKWGNKSCGQHHLEWYYQTYDWSCSCRCSGHLYFGGWCLL